MNLISNILSKQLHVNKPWLQPRSFVVSFARWPDSGEKHRGRALTTVSLEAQFRGGVNPDPATALTYHLPPYLSFTALHLRLTWPHARTTFNSYWLASDYPRSACWPINFRRVRWNSLSNRVEIDRDKLTSSSAKSFFFFFNEIQIRKSF